MITKTNIGGTAPDGSQYVTITDGGTSTILSVSSGKKAAAVAAVTLPKAAGKLSYLTGFQVTGAGATAATAFDVTVTGVVGGPLTYSHGAPAGVGVPIVPLIVSFNPPLPASAVNTDIVVSAASFGTGNTSATTNAQGIQV